MQQNASTGGNANDHVVFMTSYPAFWIQGSPFRISLDEWISCTHFVSSSMPQTLYRLITMQGVTLHFIPAWIYKTCINSNKTVNGICNAKW